MRFSSLVNLPSVIFSREINLIFTTPWAALEQEVPPRPPPKTPPKYRQLRDDLSDMKKQQANLLTQKAKLEKKLRDKDLLLKDKESMLHHLFD